MRTYIIIFIVFFALNLKAQDKGYHLKYKLTTNRNSSIHDIPFVNLPENQITTLVDYYYKGNKAKSISRIDPASSAYLYKDVLFDSIVSFFDFKEHNYHRFLGSKKNASAQNFSVEFFSGTLKKRRKMILGYKCRLVSIKQDNRLIKAWVTEDLPAHIGCMFFLESPKGAVLAWEDNLGNSAKAIDIKVGGVKDKDVDIPEHISIFEEDKALEKAQITTRAQLEVGKSLPDYSFKDIDGNLWRSTELKEKIVVFNFWFVACKPCQKEIPDLNALLEKYPEVVFLAISFDPKSKIENFLKNNKFDYQIVSDARVIAEAWEIQNYPTHLLIDQKGVIQFYKIGDDVGDLEQAIKGILKE